MSEVKYARFACTIPVAGATGLLGLVGRQWSALEFGLNFSYNPNEMKI